MNNSELKERWDQLLNPVTFRYRARKEPLDGRNPFEDDYSRLLFSSPFRRLQDKTQVFLLDKSDFIRTRLTHSLEVSTIAKSIGSSLEKQLMKEGQLSTDKISWIPNLLSAASLVHDLGNPPFGHFGEEAIKKFYLQLLNRESFKSQEYFDLINFDGNVQTFRILTRLQYLVDEYSYNLSYPTLATIIKYPKSSITGNVAKEKRKSVSEKKFGYFITEEEKYRNINSTLALRNERHPAVLLMESADDIAYSAADIEDGVKFGALSYTTIVDELAGAGHNLADNFKKYYQKEYKQHTEKDRLNLSIQRIRIDSHRVMIPSVLHEFMNNQEKILTGNYTEELIDMCGAMTIRKAYKNMANIVFDHPIIVDREIASYKIIHGILEEFCAAAASPNFRQSGDAKTYENKLYKTISSNYRFIFENYTKGEDDLYLKYQLINDYISGMTDSFAMNFYQKLRGIRL